MAAHIEKILKFPRAMHYPQCARDIQKLSNVRSSTRLCLNEVKAHDAQLLNLAVLLVLQCQGEAALPKFKKCAL